MAEIPCQPFRQIQIFDSRVEIRIAATTGAVSGNVMDADAMMPEVLKIPPRRSDLG